MKRLTCVAGVLALLGVVALTTDRAGADEEKTPTIKEVMKKLHGGPRSPLNKLKAQLKTASPPWKEVQDEAKDFETLTATLSKSNPPKGDAAAYKKLADAYHDSAKALDDAAKKEDKAATQTALNKLNMSCMNCHRAHRGR